MDHYKKIALNELWNLGISENLIDGKDIIILPENYKGDKTNLYDAQDSLTISKLLKAEGVACANSYDLNLDLPVKDRKSNDVWIGQMYILNDFVVPVVVGILQSYLQPLILQRKKRRDDRAPAADVHIDITFFKGADKTSISYDGDPESFIKIIQTFNNQNSNDGHID